MQVILNLMRREAERVGGQWARKRVGIVDAYDPSHYAVKVRLQPENTLTGWIPITSPWVGNGWGFYAGPTPGDVVEIDFQEGGKEAGFTGLRFYSTVTKPLPVPSGEFWLVHASGAFIKLTNDGKLSLQDGAGSFLTLNNDGTATLKADLTVQGTITATQDIYDLNGSKGTMQNIRTVYDTHTHSGVQTGGGNTGVPNQPL
jgi:hypothetical protein